MNEPMTEAGRPQLEAFIRERIAAAGGITFAEYMGHCLYHPEHGYYIAPRRRIGKEGDFYTSTSVHAAFGRLICRQLEEMWRLLGAGPFTIAEQGAGEGHLCLDILQAAAEEHPEFYRALRYALVEISSDNRQRQKELLGAHLDRVVWCELAELAGMEGCFLSNELVDAFPVHLVEMRGGHLREVFVVDQDGAFAEELRPLSTDRLRQHLDALGVSLGEGARAEVNLEAPRWMAEVGGVLKRGFVITVDYGYPAAELYAPWRNRGSLMCYHRHTSSEDPYRMPGCQDITAHVDFTTLEQAGRTQGLEPLFFGEQYRFLLGLGFVEVLLEMEARSRDEKEARALRLTLKNLIMPDGGMGETFKVLVQGKGVGAVNLLCQRRIADLAPALGGML